MRRPLGIGLVVALGCLVAACSSGGGDSSSTTTTTASGGTTTTATSWTAAELEGALLQPSQMPAGWTVAVAPSTGTSEPATKSDLLCPAGVAAFDSASAGVGNPQAQVSYQSDEVQLLESVEAAPSGGTMAILDGLSSAMGACNGQVWTSSGGIEFTSILAVAPPVPGSSIGLRLVGTDSNGPMAFVFMAIAVESQDAVIEIILAEPGTSGVDQSVLAPIVDDAVANVEAL